MSGLIDTLSASGQSANVASYGIRLLKSSYTNAVVRIRRSTDNVEQDFYANTTGSAVGTATGGSGTTLASWLGAATGYVTTWYDQTGRNKHMTQTTQSSQPTIVLDSGTSTYAVYFNNTLRLTGPNVFDTTTVSDMHMVFASKEISRVDNYMVCLNGVSNNPRFSSHTPWSDGSWYWDSPFDGTNRVNSSSNPTAVGSRAIFSGYKSNGDGRNGFRLNGGTRFLSAGTSAGTVSGGIALNIDDFSKANHYLYSLVIFSSKLSSADETLMESGI